METTKIKEKFVETKKKIVQKFDETKKNIGEFVSNNPMIVLPLIGIAGSVVSGLLTGASNRRDSREEDCLVEDDITGQNFRTVHPMTNLEILELGERMIDGQTKGDALNTMGLLRNEKRR